MKFETFNQKESAFKRTIELVEWAGIVKAEEKVKSLQVTNVLKGEAEDAKYVICTLDNGKSCTFPVSKKAKVGAPVTDYKMAENNDGEWVVVTGSGAEATTL